MDFIYFPHINPKFILSFLPLLSKINDRYFINSCYPNETLMNLHTICSLPAFDVCFKMNSVLSLATVTAHYDFIFFIDTDL